MSPQEFLNTVNWQYRSVSSGKELQVQRCPYCNDERGKMNINASTGLFRCFHCNERGGLGRLIKEFSGRTRISAVSEVMGLKKDIEAKLATFDIEGAHKDLLDPKNAAALEYLEKYRGFSRNAIEHFKLGYHEYPMRGGKTPCISIPHFKKGKVVCVKFRLLPPKDAELQVRYLRLPNCETVLFNQDIIEKFDDVLLCEGEFNAIAAWDHGIENAIAMTVGAGSFLPQFRDVLVSKQVLVVFDQDTAGQDGAKVVAKRVGLKHCMNLVLPKEEGEKKCDLNQYFLRGATKETFLAYSSEHSQPFGVAHVRHISEVLEDLRKRKEKMDTMKENGEEVQQGQDPMNVIAWPWKSLDTIGGEKVRAGELIVIAAHPGTGKTTFAMQLVDHNAKLQVPSFLYCIEYDEVTLCQKLPQFMFGKQYERLDSTEHDQLILAYKSLPMYLGYSDMSVQRPEVLDTMRAAIERFDLKLLVFDNLQFLVRSQDYAEQETSLVTKTMKSLAMEYGIVIVLVCQPRKCDPAIPPGMMDLKNSSAIGADADRVLILFRRTKVDAKGLKKIESYAPQMDTLSPETLVAFAKNRFGQSREGMLLFDETKIKFVDPVDLYAQGSGLQEKAPATGEEEDTSSRPLF